MKCYAVLDIGKTHVKLQLVDENYQTLFSANCTNYVLKTDLYPHMDVEGIWSWFLVQMRKAASMYSIAAINVSAHGATAALVNQNGLTLPIMDYEWKGVAKNENYERLRPAFNETYSPSLPGGLNLGRQLFWMEKNYPEQFSAATAILMYPQFWVWRMTGKLVSEVTSLGCHTDLWNINASTYSSLVTYCGWKDKFPPIHSALEPVAYVSKSFIEQTGVNADCVVFSGLHDSNASYLRYMNHEGRVDKTIVSTGTWTVFFSPHTQLETLNEKHDMLANVDINKKAVPCARFMGGREFGVICQQLDTPIDEPVSVQDIQCLIDQEIMALPDFSGGSGPFGGRKSQVLGWAIHGAALATLYTALMMDYELTLLNSENDIVIEGAFVKNSLLCSLLAQLRPDVSIWTSSDTTGTVFGAASLCMQSDYIQIQRSENRQCLENLSRCEPTDLKRLDVYRNEWRHMLL